MTIMDNERAVSVAVRILPCSTENNIKKPYYVQTEQCIAADANKAQIVSTNIPAPTDGVNTGSVHVLTPNASESNDNNGNTKRTTFTFQHAMPYGCTQQDIYTDAVLPLIKKLLQGYDTSFITYGQCRTGKSYTIFGPGFDCIYGESEQGIVQRAIRDIFGHLMKRQADCRYSINCTWIEVHGNEVHDISAGRVIQCHTINDVFQCIQLGLSNRQHDQSNTLFTLTLEQQWITPNGLIQHRLSTASFCDLCGTYRMPAIDQLTQTPISIPKDCGLQALERIVTLLTDHKFNGTDSNNASVLAQYDETVLTKLLKDSFGGRAYTLMILCVSPLEQDLVETVQNLQFANKVQFVQNDASMNTFSDNNMPVTGLIDPTIMGPAALSNANQTLPVPLPQALHYNPAVSERSNATNTQNAFTIKYAASQWLKLVSNAEGLFSELLVNGNSLNEQDRERIEEWMYLKQECEECLSSAELVTNQRQLGPIQETDEHEESEGKAVETDGFESNSVSNRTIKNSQFEGANTFPPNTVYSEDESDSEDMLEQEDDLEDKMAELMVNVGTQTNDFIEENYNNFTAKYPKAITNSLDDVINNIAVGAVKLKHLSSVAAAPDPNTDGATVAADIDDDDDREIARASGAGRRRSIQPCDNSSGDRLALSTADVERLQKIADDGIRNSQSLNLNNSVCRWANKFLDSSSDGHPLRVFHANRAQDSLLTKIRKLSYDCDDKEKRIKVLRENIGHTIELINEHTNEQRANAKKTLKSRESRLKAEREKRKRLLESKSRHDKDNIQLLQTELQTIEKELYKLKNTQEISAVSDKKIDEYQANLQKQQKDLKRLTKQIKKDRKLLDELRDKYERNERFKDTKCDKRSISLTTNMNTRIAQLDNVLKEKKERVNEDGETGKVESIRCEIRNLRGERERLCNAQYALTEKLKKDKKLNERDAREMLELDVATEAIDHAVEQKNLLICGRELPNKYGGFSDNTDLMRQLAKLNENEKLILLSKFFHKIVDLRYACRQQEYQIVQYEHERKEAELHKIELVSQIELLRLTLEQHSINLCKQEEARYTKLLQMAASGYEVTPPNDMMMMLAPSRNNFLENIPSKTSHLRQHTVGNDIKIMQGINGYSESSSKRPRSSYRMANAAIAAAPKLDISELYDQKQKTKNLPRLLLAQASIAHLPNASRRGHGNLLFYEQPSAANITEPKVIVANKKIIINQNKPSSS